MSQAIPKKLADYLETVPGRFMVEGSAYFAWSLDRDAIVVSGSTPPQDHPYAYVEPEGCITFVRDGDGWKRWTKPE